MGDDQKATNEGGRGLRTQNIVVDWLWHWFHVAGTKHRGGFRGRPSTFTGLFGRECQRLRMTPRVGESKKAFQERCDRLLNALIPVSVQRGARPGSTYCSALCFPPEVALVICFFFSESLWFTV